jgi:hypothetical protein
MCGDIVEVRRRLLERAAAHARDGEMKWKRKIIVGLETLVKYLKKHPEVQAVFDEFARQLRHPSIRLNPSESDQIKPTSPGF